MAFHDIGTLERELDPYYRNILHEALGGGRATVDELLAERMAEIARQRMMAKTAPIALQWFREAPPEEQAEIARMPQWRDITDFARWEMGLPLIPSPRLGGALVPPRSTSQELMTDLRRAQIALQKASEEAARYRAEIMKGRARQLTEPISLAQADYEQRVDAFDKVWEKVYQRTTDLVRRYAESQEGLSPVRLSRIAETLYGGAAAVHSAVPLMPPEVERGGILTGPEGEPLLTNRPIVRGLPQPDPNALRRALFTSDTVATFLVRELAKNLEGTNILDAPAELQAAADTVRSIVNRMAMNRMLSREGMTVVYSMMSQLMDELGITPFVVPVRDPTTGQTFDVIQWLSQEEIAQLPPEARAQLAPFGPQPVPEEEGPGLIERLRQRLFGGPRAPERTSPRQRALRRFFLGPDIAGIEEE